MHADEPIPRPIFGRIDEARAEFIARREREPRYVLMGRLVALSLPPKPGRGFVISATTHGRPA